MVSKEDQQTFRARLRDAGLRVTGPRVSVLGIVAAATKPISHGEIADKLDDAGVDPATIFRNLQDLVGRGILKRTDLGDHVWRYELAGVGGAHPVDGHPHFVCSACGTVSCLTGAMVTVKASKVAPASVRKGRFELHLRGVCDACTS